MKHKIITAAFLGFALFINACGASSNPTVSPVDVQNTAIAAAFTIVAETHAAIPTDTPILPTETATQPSLPTDTPLPLPTETAVATATLTQDSGGSDPCNVPLKVSGGLLTKIRILNKTGSPITVSLFLHKTPFGDCGYKGYNIVKGGSITITDLPVGCYSVSVFVNDPKKPIQSSGYGCPNNPDQWTFEVRREAVTFIGK
jgi:hypothetical protein